MDSNSLERNSNDDDKSTPAPIILERHFGPIEVGLSDVGLCDASKMSPVSLVKLLSGT